MELCAWIRGPLDLASYPKIRRYKEACEKERWLCGVCVTDTYVAMAKRARALTKELVKCLERSTKFEGGKAFANKMWYAMSTAEILRTAIPLASHARHTPGA